MPVPSPRNKILPVRGDIATLQANIASILEGEICYAFDKDQYYQKENGVLVPAGASKDQGALADSATQPGDNISTLANDAGYITAAQVPEDAVTSVAGRTGDVVLTKADVGLDSVDNTSDADKPVSTAQQAIFDVKADLVGGVIPTSQIPAIAITEFLGSVGSEAAMLALTGQPGDWCLRTDKSVGYVIVGADPSLASNWEAFTVPGSAVTSINSQIGDVVLGFADVGAASAAQGTLADSAVQPGDNVSDLVNDAGYITAAQVPGDAVTSVNTQTGDVVLDADDVGAVPVTGGTFSGNIEIGTGIELNADGNAYVRTALKVGDVTTAAPAALLHVTESGVPDILLQDRSLANRTLKIDHTDGVSGFYSRRGTANGTFAFYGDNGTTITEFARIDSSGDLLIGGTLPSAANIELNANGSAEFAGSLSSTNYSSGGVTESWQIAPYGMFTATRSANTDPVFRAYQVGSTSSPNALITADGSAQFAGDVQIGDNSTGTKISTGSTIRTYASGNIVTGQDNTIALGIHPSGTASRAWGGFIQLTGRDRVQDTPGTDNPSVIIDGGRATDGASDGNIWFYTGKNSNTGTPKALIEAAGSLLIGGTLPSAPNISLASSGAITASTYNGLSIARDTKFNIGLGADTLPSVTGFYNLAWGYQSLYKTTSGSSNVGIGYKALTENITGASNVGVGYKALSVATGSRNTALGDSAGIFITGSNNTILGAYEGSAADASLNNTIILAAGRNEKLRIDSTGSLLFGGTLPLAPNISLDNNGEGTFAGDVKSLGFLTSSDTAANDRVQFGYMATPTGHSLGHRIVGDGQNLYYFSRENGTTGHKFYVHGSGGSSHLMEINGTPTDEKVMIGGTLPTSPNITLNADGSIVTTADATINSLTVGRGGGGIDTNTVVGNNAFKANTTGLQNVATGTNALTANLTGQKNVATGHNALGSNTGGSENVATGRLTLYSNTTGNYNNSIGSGSLFSNIGGSYNVAIGNEAGYYIEGSNNTILGPYKGVAGDSALNNTVIISAGTAERLRIDSTGSLLFGGTLPSSPNISLATTGVSSFNGRVITKDKLVVNGADDSVVAQLYGTNGGINRGLELSLDTGGTAQNALVRFDAKHANSGSMVFATRGQDCMFVDSAGTVGIGGTLPSSPNITLNADGSAEFAGGYANINSAGTITAGRAGNAAVFIGKTGNAFSGTTTSTIYSNGSANFTGDITCTDNSKGLILKSPDGTSFRLSVANDGTLSATSI